MTRQQVMMPQPQNSDGQIFQVGGTVIGGALGGTPGAAVGGMVGGGVSPQPPRPQALQTSDNGSQADAMMRRSQQLTQDNMQTLTQAEAALPTLPEDLRQQYAPAITQARMLQQQQQQTGMV